jgi:hypothetical protein
MTARDDHRRPIGEDLSVDYRRLVHAGAPLGLAAGPPVRRSPAYQHHSATATGSWTIYRWGWQFTGSEGLDEAYLPFFGAFGAAWDDAMVARWSVNPLGMLWREMDAALVVSVAEGVTSDGRAED